MEDNDLHFEAIQNMELEALDNIGRADIAEDDVDGDDFQESVDPALFYLACQKALTRLKTYAASNPSF